MQKIVVSALVSEVTLVIPSPDVDLNASLTTTVILAKPVSVPNVLIPVQTLAGSMQGAWYITTSPFAPVLSLTLEIRLNNALQFRVITY
jgi:hypothetical protein